MTEESEPQSPSDTSQLALKAAEIIAETKAQSGKYRELPEQRLTCDCTPGRKVIARVFVGVEADGTARAWLWVPGVKSGKERPSSPPLCAPVPQRAGEQVWPLTAICPRCKSGHLLLLGADGPGTVRVIDIESPTYGVVDG